MGIAGDFLERGWSTFGHDDQVLEWVNHLCPIAENLSQDSKHIAEWLRFDGTWFAGVNILENDAAGRVGGGPDLTGTAIDFLKDHGQWRPLDKGQLSVVYPNYPGFDGTETEGAHRYRRLRDGAHVDGLHPVGPGRRRYLSEPHGFVLGIPLNTTHHGASPMVVWDKSHEVMRGAFLSVLGNVPIQDWSSVDLTDAYHAARKHCFENCDRIEIEAVPGECYLLHRLSLHGIAPWADNAIAPKSGRMIAYFRPEAEGGVEDWLRAP